MRGRNQVAESCLRRGQIAAYGEDRHGQRQGPAKDPRAQCRAALDALRLGLERLELGQLAAHRLEAVVGVVVAAGARLDLSSRALRSRKLRTISSSLASLRCASRSAGRRASGAPGRRLPAARRPCRRAGRGRATGGARSPAAARACCAVSATKLSRAMSGTVERRRSGSRGRRVRARSCVSSERTKPCDRQLSARRHASHADNQNSAPAKRSGARNAGKSLSIARRPRRAEHRSPRGERYCAALVGPQRQSQDFSWALVS